MGLDGVSTWRRNPQLWLWLRRLVWVLACVPFVLQVQGIVTNTLGADPAKELALDTGRWTLRFLLMSLAITPLREIFSLGSLAPLRRTLGLFALFYASLHFLVYILFLLELRWYEIGTDILERPYITVGFVAFLILLAMGITSPKRMVRRLGKRWKPLHRMVYLAAVLSILHLVWILRTDVFDAVFYGTLLALLLAYRGFNSVRKRTNRPIRN
ncbi:Sulfoxide reductase heme-binding subunit YedZ [Pseudohongiella spirulinae]|uniref:Protein-methionine-sulfoxide reductase heme-binding subunit MsrQ n=1 Tax=Pseudohongiella spirulinae TaxID=1249552 RepID=A0A0S2KEP5_9GAMM|nr:Sulfoxide reductase heme-binding subunit YedZ [Pseudohongiella spirulinae]